MLILFRIIDLFEGISKTNFILICDPLAGTPTSVSRLHAL